MLGEGANLDAALAHASAAGALSCTKLGAQTSFPDRAQIDLALNEYY
jgi:sugar/nucleoside kinase (ribokinase family)